MISFPFDMPRFEYQCANPNITRCTICFNRQQEGKPPACLENCPAETLMFVTRRELLAEARKRIAENPDMYVDYICGETEAGGTSILCLSPIPFEEIGFKINVQKIILPSISKGIPVQYTINFCFTTLVGT